MRGVRLHRLAGVGCAFFVSACSLLTTFDGFSGGPGDDRDAGPGAPDTGVPTKDAAGGDVDAEAPESGSSDATFPDGEDALSCEGNLSGIGTADFTISMTLITRQTGTVAVVNQRSVCNGSDFWDVHLENGDVAAETDDGLMHHAVDNTTGPAVNDGKPHAISIQRRNETLTVYVDGVAAGSAVSASTFGMLPLVEWTTSPCVGHTNYYSLVGSVTNRCVTSP
jgi:hypothetical protein